MERWGRVGFLSPVWGSFLLSPHLLSLFICCHVVTMQLTQCDPSTRLPGCPTQQH